LEVMIAMAIFFMAIFAILGLVSQNLRIARSLRMGDIDFGSVAAEVSLTNQLEEGVISGDFGDLYPGAAWTAEVMLVGTNANSRVGAFTSKGLFQVDLTIDWPEHGVAKQKQTSILLFRP